MKHAGYIGGDNDALLTKYPEPQISWKAASQPFTVEVSLNSRLNDLSFNSLRNSLKAWLGWLLSLVFITMASAVIVLMRSKFVKQDQPLRALNEMIMYIVGTITAQGSQIKKFFS
jgi:hypothetical protein